MNKNITHKYWMDIVNNIAQASTCNRANIGTIIINHQNVIVGVGFLGSIHGDKHCDDNDNNKCLLVSNNNEYGSDNQGLSCIRTIHSEMNAILKCKERGNKKDGWLICYTTYEPCLNCFKLLLQIGVRKIFYKHMYKDFNRDHLILNLHEHICYNLIYEKIT